MTSDVLFEEIPGNQGNIGLITLNRPQALNALNHDMFIAIRTHLKKWQVQETIKAVVIRAVPGRAFSAGGDIRSAYERKMKKDPSLKIFFSDEYEVNSLIFHFPKPYIALLDGITMGGGAGISIHGSHRVATERLVFAMPETTIGFYPDIGASYFLSRMPNYIGYYLGLTGEKIAYPDCYALGLMDVLVSPESLDAMFNQLLETPLPNKNAVTEIIKPFSCAVPPSTLLNHQTDIQTCFSKNSVEEIMSALENRGNDWSRETANILKKKSPTSLKVTLQELNHGKTVDFDACMQMENHITQRMIQEHDFFEGIRALLIDKDQTPHWKPTILDDVTVEEVNSYFEMVKM